MLSHSLIVYAPEVSLFKPITRSATPTFLILFGIMLEVAYLSKVRAGRSLLSARRRLLGKAITCYLLFALITLAAFVTGKLAVTETRDALLMSGGGRFGNILTLYTAMFLIFFLAAPLVLRHGAPLVAGAAAICWLASGVAAHGELSDAYALQYLLGHDAGRGPAVLLGLVLVAFGMFIGEALTGRRSWHAAGAMLAGATTLLVHDAVTTARSEGPKAFLSDLVYVYRGTNKPTYYAYGMICAATYMLLFRYLGNTGVSRFFAALGWQTLFYYGFGNILLNLLPEYSAAFPFDMLIVAAFIGVLTVLALDRASVEPLQQRLSFGIFDSVGRVYSGAVSRSIDQVPFLRDAARR